LEAAEGIPEPMMALKEAIAAADGLLLATAGPPEASVSWRPDFPIFAAGRNSVAFRLIRLLSDLRGFRGESARIRCILRRRLGSDPVKVLRFGRCLAVLDPLDPFDQLDMARGGDADFLAPLSDDAVDEVDLGAPALVHVLTHGRTRQIAAGVRIE